MGKIQALGISTGQMSTARRWRSFASLFAFSTVAMYLQLKVSPVITNLANDFGLASTSAGMLVSFFALMALVLAVPAAGFMHKFGIKATLMCAALVSLVGTVIGLVGANLPCIMVSRVLEGCGLAFGATAGGAVIPRLFQGKGMGLAMGVWSLWTLPGNIIVFVSTPLLYSFGGWKAIWVFSLIIEALCVLWLAIEFVLPAETAGDAGSAEQGGVQGKPHTVSAAVVAVCMLFWTIAMGFFMVYYPTYLQQVKDVPVFTASLVTMVFAIVAAPFGVWFGALSEKLRARKWFVCVPFAVVAVIMATIGFTSGTSLVPVAVFICIFGVCGAAIPMGIYALVPVLARDHKKTDYLMAVTAVGMQLGNVIVGLCGPVIAAHGFHGLAMMLVVPVSCIAAVAVFLSKGERD